MAAFDIGSSSPELSERLPLILLHACFFICFVGFDVLNRWLPISGHMALATFSTLQLLLIWFGSNPTTQIILLFVQSAYAHEVLPEFPANLWIFGYGIGSMIGFSILTENPVMGSLIGLGSLGGYAYIGGATQNRRAAEAARAESQRLLQELQVAHEQLQHHAHEAEVLAAAEERNRVARELHDTLGHRLTVAAVQLEGAHRLIGRDADKAAQIVEIVRGQVLDGLTELRQTVAALRTPIEADLALPAAITRLANQYAAATGLIVQMQIDEQLHPHFEQLSRSTCHTLFRTVQEGLTNVQKHADATHAWIHLDFTQDKQPTVRLTVHDNGVGVRQEAEAPGFGLAGLAERAAHMDGTIRLEASPYGGSALSIILPIEQPLPVLVNQPI